MIPRSRWATLWMHKGIRKKWSPACCICIAGLSFFESFFMSARFILNIFSDWVQQKCLLKIPRAPYNDGPAHDGRCNCCADRYRYWLEYLFTKRKRTLRECSFSFGRGIRIRTLNNGVRENGLLSETHRFKPNFRVWISQKSLAYCVLNVENL